MTVPGAAALRLLKEFEGLRSAVYRCPAGLPTIGYGHVLRPGEAFPHPLSEAEAEGLLLRDAAQALAAVQRLIHWPLNLHQRDALACFTFNLGAAALQRSTLRRRLNRGELDRIGEEWQRWVWAGGRKLPGLIRRRQAELHLFLSGDYPLHPVIPAKAGISGD